MDHREVLPVGAELVGDYRIEGILGQGGFGVTYKAEHLKLGTTVAIKEYYPSQFAMRDGTLSIRPRTGSHAELFEWGRTRFLDEARTLAKFDHPTIVRVLHVFEVLNTAYMVLKFEAGKSLRSWLQELGRMPTQAELDRLARPLIQAVGLLHKSSYIHRDIAPDNIIVRPDGTPVLLDFGSARYAIAEETRAMTGLVKHGYSPPEQYSASATRQGAWTDIYAIGATFYRAVTGETPQSSTDRMLEDKLIPTRQAAFGTYRPAFLDAIDWAMRINPTARPRTAEDFEAAMFADIAAAPVSGEQAASRRAPSPAPVQTPTQAPAQAPTRMATQATGKPATQRAATQADRRPQPAHRPQTSAPPPPAAPAAPPPRQTPSPPQPVAAAGLGQARLPPPSTGGFNWAIVFATIAVLGGAGAYLLYPAAQSGRKEPAKVASSQPAESPPPAVTAEPPRTEPPVRPAPAPKPPVAQERPPGPSETPAQPGERLRVVTGLPGRERSLMLTPGAGKSESFRDCDGCPEMVVAPAGTFTIGSAAEEIGHRPEEGPQRTVRILRPFAVGKHEVTRAQFEVFMKESGYEPGISCQVYVPASKRWERAEGKTFREPGFPQTDQDPVVCVSWNDAQAYASWLSNKTGKRYRLLSEAEWEYVARAGSTGPYWWGPSASHNEANFGRDPCCGPLKEGRDQWDHTSPVGRFPANPFGLYDVLGNVWEWVEDCWNGNYEGMPTDGSARTGGDCTRRIFRGGSIYSDPSNLRAAYRSRNAPTIRPPNFGMRIARTLD